ncbi:ABC transporter substrate-binding protein [Paenibacillus luteus]|uniref:ABC transporter substrate-binding protein n=1 Tax=Paenibacillus luteus TaxID=2545753 RepID=UPI00114231D2|nr:ABC transporter substrate-binding protein [Paenibacillus luteus]
MLHLKRTVSASLILILILAALAACSSNSGNNEGTTPSASPTGTANESTNNEEAAAPSDTRIVQTDKGDITVPANPQRIVSAYYHGTLLALGLQPIGANKEWWMGSPFLKEQEKMIEDIGAPTSLEKVTTLEPDLILINDFDVEIYDQLAKIAPTVHVPYTAYKNPKEEVKLFGELLGKQEEAAKWLATYEQTAEAGREKIKAAVAPGETAVLINVREKKLSILGDNYGRGGYAIYDALQLKAPDIVQKEVIDSGLQIKEISLEVLPQYADADHIFICFNTGTAQEDIDNILNNPVWKNLPAVKNGNLHILDYNTYLHYDPISIVGQIDLIANILIK